MWYNVELTPAFFDMKFSRLDLKLEVDGRIVNIEMQVNREADFKEAYYREKRLHDEASALGSARRERIEEGMVRGEAKGRAEGRAEERYKIAEKMRQSGYTEEQICQLLGDDING